MSPFLNIYFDLYSSSLLSNYEGMISYFLISNIYSYSTINGCVNNLEQLLNSEESWSWVYWWFSVMNSWRSNSLSLINCSISLRPSYNNFAWYKMSWELTGSFIISVFFIKHLWHRNCPVLILKYSIFSS